MSNTVSSFLSLALSKKVVTSALKVALFVGTLLALINHGAALINMDLSMSQAIQILLTYLVPYSVSTYSSVNAIQEHQRIMYTEK